MVAEGYKSVEAILDNVLRFNHGRLNRQMLCEQMYNGIRREFAQELLQEAKASADAYTRLRAIINILESK